MVVIFQLKKLWNSAHNIYRSTQISGQIPFLGIRNSRRELSVLNKPIKKNAKQCKL